jgi:hypothetical protein
MAIATPELSIPKATEDFVEVPGHMYEARVQRVRADGTIASFSVKIPLVTSALADPTSREDEVEQIGNGVFKKVVLHKLEGAVNPNRNRYEITFVGAVETMLRLKKEQRH